MEFSHSHQPDWTDHLVLAHFEPIGNLAPYLAGIDLSSDQAAFDRLVGSSPGADQIQRAEKALTPASPVNSWAAGSQPSSPRVQLSCSHSLNSSLSSCSWTPSSPASSCTSHCSSSGQRTGPRKRPLKACGHIRPEGDTYKRSCNATAAERYRLKLKGRQCGLEKLVELEERRNAELRRLLESKLSLYREFIYMLANNLQDRDVELASIGCRSIEQIFADYRPTETDSDSDGNSTRQRLTPLIQHQDATDKNIEKIDSELKQVLQRFRLVLRCKQVAGAHDQLDSLEHYEQLDATSDWIWTDNEYIAHYEPHRYSASVGAWPTPTTQYS